MIGMVGAEILPCMFRRIKRTHKYAVIICGSPAAVIAMEMAAAVHIYLTENVKFR
jgi:hypothetical protein